MANYVLKSKVKEFVSKKGFRLSGDAIEALDKKVEQLLKEAVERAKANKRQTVKPADF